MKSSSSCCTRNGDREIRSTMETTSGAWSPSLPEHLQFPKQASSTSYVDVEYSQVQHLLERDEQGAEVGSCDKTGF